MAWKARAFLLASTLLGASTILHAQDQRVSEEAVRCFVQACASAAGVDGSAAATPPAAPSAQTAAVTPGAAAEDECLTSGICAVGGTKKFSIANMGRGNAGQASAALAPRSAAPAARPGASAQRVAAPARSAAIRQAFAPSGARQSLDMRLSFELNSADLTSGARDQANVFAKVLRESAGSGRFVIEGHTDSVGSAASNEQLSKRRAESVVSYLVAQGVPKDRLAAVGYGFRHPREGLGASDPRNRRVEIVKLAARR